MLNYVQLDYSIYTSCIDVHIFDGVPQTQVSWMFSLAFRHILEYISCWAPSRGKGIEFPEGNPYECTVKPGEQLETPTVMTADKSKQLGGEKVPSQKTDFTREKIIVIPVMVHDFFYVSA